MYNDDNYENYETEDTEVEESSGSTLKDIYYNNKKLIWILGIIIVVIILVSLFNRGSSSDSNAYVKPVNKNESVQLSRSKDLKIKVGNNEYNGSSDRLNWKSRNTSIAEIDSNGRATGKAIGTTIIDVTYIESGKSYVTAINLNVFKGNENVPLQSADFDGKSLVMSVNNHFNLGDKISVTPDSAYVYNIQYEVSNPNIVTVDEGGLVTAQGEGHTTITAYVNETAYKTQIEVYVNNAYKDAELIKLPQKIDFQNGQTIRIPVNNGSVTEIKLDLSPSDSSTKYISWKSSDENIIAVSGEGNVAALKEGSATVTATSINGVVGKILVEGTNDLVNIDSISITPSNVSLTVGSSSTLVPTVSPDSASNKALIFESSNNSVVSVIPNTTKTSATIYGVGTGTAVVTIKSDNGKSATVTVTVTGGGSSPSTPQGPSSGGSIAVRLGDSANIVPKKKCDGVVDYYSAPLKVTINKVSGNANYISYCYTKGCTPSDSKREKLPVTFEIKNSGTYILKVKKYTGESGNNEIKSSGSGNYDNGSLVYYINTKSSGLSCTSSSTWESGGSISTASEAKNACYCRNDNGDYSCTWAKQGSASFPSINTDFNTEAKCNLHVKQTCCHLQNGSYVNGLTSKSNCVADSKCGTSGSDKLIAIDVNVSNVTLKVNETKRISVTLKPSSVSEEVKIKVADDSVVSVNKPSIKSSTEFIIMANKEGKTTIKLEGNGITTVISVNVSGNGTSKEQEQIKQPAICPVVESVTAQLDGKSHQLNVKTPAIGGTAMYKYSGVSWSDVVPGRVWAGTTTVEIKVVGDSNHTDVNCPSKTITITNSSGSQKDDTQTKDTEPVCKILGKFHERSCEEKKALYASSELDLSNIRKTLTTGKTYICYNNSNSSLYEMYECTK